MIFLIYLLKNNSINQLKKFKNHIVYATIPCLKIYILPGFSTSSLKNAVLQPESVSKSPGSGLPTTTKKPRRTP